MGNYNDDTTSVGQQEAVDLLLNALDNSLVSEEEAAKILGSAWAKSLCFGDLGENDSVYTHCKSCWFKRPLVVSEHHPELLINGYMYIVECPHCHISNCDIFVRKEIPPVVQITFTRSSAQVELGHTQ